MNSESDRLSIPRALNDMRASILLLAIGHEYLCNEPFMRKMGQEIDSHIEPLKRAITKIKSAIPGTYAQENDPLGILKEIHDRVRHLMEPSQETTKKCANGDFGRDLEGQLDTLTLAITQLGNYNKGKTPKYSFIEVFFQNLPRLVPSKSLVLAPFRTFLKTLIPFLLLALFSFSYLFVSMDREKDVLKDIEKKEVALQAKQEMMAQNRARHQEILNKIRFLENRQHPISQNRQDKLEMIDLNVTLQEIEQAHHLLKIQISAAQKSVTADRERIEEIRQKTFIQRLLKQ